MTDIIYSIKKYETPETDYPDISLDEINTIRKRVGLYELKEKFRKCMNCREVFRSIQFRMCGKCRKVANMDMICDEIDKSKTKSELEDSVFELKIQIDNLKTDRKKLLKSLDSLSKKLSFALSEIDKTLVFYKK